MTKLLEIAQLGNPVLRIKTSVVTGINQSIIQLIEDMKWTVNTVNGVGIAAPQVFESKRIFIIASKPNERYPNAPFLEPVAMINPEIKELSSELEKDWEGCLSIPGIRGLVPRSKHLVIEYTNRAGERIIKKYSDFIARVIQHEFDHLEGIMFLDRLESNKDLVSEFEYQRIITGK
ncbi:MAG: peptide deformylase [Melioribacteraceae bacterium]|nr:peptide deformylase [Melioribacteraceae bacterium]